MIDKVDLVSKTQWLPEGDRAPRLIVCEQSGRWAVGLRRHLGPLGPRVYETRSLAGCWEIIAQATASFVIVEAGRANLAMLLDRLAESERQYPLAAVGVVADRGLVSAEWLLREAGAVDFTTSPRRLESLARLACRHIEQAPRPRRTLTQQIWADLPWGEERR